MKILLTGASGQIGSQILKILGDRHEVIAGVRGKEVDGAQNVNLDLTDEASIREAMQTVSPDALIHSAAMTSPEKCENEKEKCLQTNVEATKLLARECAETGAKMIYLSTDLVFDGEKGDYDESDEPAPLNFYAQSKLDGEAEIKKILPEAIIARTAIVFGKGPPAHGGFAGWLNDTMRRGDRAYLFTDQYRSHFYSPDCARAIGLLLDGNFAGLYHLSPGRNESRFEFGLALAKALELDTSLIVPVTMEDKPSPAKRPGDCSLANNKLVNDTGFEPTPLDESLEELKVAFSI